MGRSYVKGCLLFLAVMATAWCKAQHDTTLRYPGPEDYKNARVFTFVEQNPQFPGGDATLMKFLKDNIKYPDYERLLNIQGKVLLRFVVAEDGSVADVVVTRSVSKGLDEESIRVVKLLPKFKPGTQQGKPVRVYFNLPVVYRLTGEDYFTAGMENLARYDKDFATAVTALRNRDFATAINIFAREARKYNNGNIYDLLWVCYKETGDKKSMCAALKKAIKFGHPEEQGSLERLCW